MSGSISAPFIRYPIGTSLMMAASCSSALSPIPLLPVAPCPGRLPDHSGLRTATRRQPGNHGLVGGTAAGAAARADPRRRADDLDELLGTAAITVQFDLNRPYRRRGQRRAGRDSASGQLPKSLLAADLPQGQPGGLADPLAVGDLGNAALTTVSDAVDAQLAQQISQISGVAQVTSAASRSRRSASRSIRRSSSPRACRWRTCAARSRSRRSTAQGNIDGATRNYTIYANDQLPDSKDWNDVIIAYRNGGRCGSATSARPLPDPRTPSRRPGPTASAACSWCIQAARRQRHRDRRQDQGELPRLVAAIPPAIKIEVISDRTQTIRAAVEDVQFTLLLTIALVVMVIFIFLRSFWATVIPTSRCRWRCSAPAR